MSLKEQIAEAGNKLLQPPSSVDELLPLLDQVESSLSKVEQSPGQYMDDALSPLKEAMVANDLLRHSDIDVKAAVASCISEITRITAPDAPYDDDKMKDVFQLIVSSFENLHDQTSRSYHKRVLILEIVAKVKSFNFMLDLECNRLITEMFQHFLKAIRDYHTVNILSYMVSIMTCVLEESEEVSLELLSPLLASVKKDKEVTPAAKWLGETVFENCAAKLKPCLKKAVESLHISLAEYSNIVTLVLEGALPAVDRVNDTVSKDLLAAESKLADLPEAVQATQEPETTHRQSAPKESKGQAVNVAPSTPGQSQPDENITKKAAQSKKESLNKEDSVFKKGSEATSDIEAKQARRSLKKALLETSHKENEGGSSSNTEAKKQKQSVEQMQCECPRADGEVNTRKRVKKPPQRADDEFKTRKLVQMPVKTKVKMPVETRIKKPVEIRKWLSFPLLVAGLRAKDEMAISQFKDLLLIEWSVRTSIFTDFSEKLQRARCRKKKSIAAKFLQIIFDDCTHWPETSDLVLIGPKLKAQFETLLCSKEFTSLGSVFAGVWSDQADLQVLAILRFRELFKDPRCPPKRLIINSGVIPRFDEFLGKDDSPNLQRVAALALIDITSEMAYSIEDLMNHKLVEILIKILDIQDFYVRKKAVSQLGNIAELPEGRDFVHRHEVVRPLVENFFSPLLWLMGFVENYKYPKMLRVANYKYLKMLRIATYTLLRLCEGASRPDVDETENKNGSMIVYTPAELMSKGRHLEKVKEALPVLVQLVDLSDEEVLINACSVLACLTDNTYWKTKVEINDSTCVRLVQLVHESPSVGTPALRTLGNIVARDDNLSKCIVDFGAPLLWDLLSKSIEEVEVWRTIANITKRTPIQIEEKQKLKVKENLDKSGMVKLSLLCVELGIPYPIATPRKEDIVAKLMNFLDPYAMTSDHEKEESREGKKRRRESAEQMSQEDIVAKSDFLDAPHAIMTSELLDEKEESREVKKKRRRESAEDAPSDDELFCAIGEIFKEVDITKEIKFTDILERLCKRFGTVTVLTRRKKYIPIMIEYQLHRIFLEDEDEDEDFSFRREVPCSVEHPVAISMNEYQPHDIVAPS